MGANALAETCGLSSNKDAHMLQYHARVTSNLQTVEWKAKVSNRNNQVSYLTGNTSWESDKNARKHHTQES